MKINEQHNSKAMDEKKRQTYNLYLQKVIIN